MASMSKAMLDKYIDIAVRPLRNAETARKDRIREDKDKFIEAFTKERNIEDLYIDAVRLRDNIRKMETEISAMREKFAVLGKEMGKKIDVPSWVKQNVYDFFNHMDDYVLNGAINSDPGLKRIHSEIQRIKDAIYLAPAPDKIAELIKSIDLSFLDEIVHDG